MTHLIFSRPLPSQTAKTGWFTERAAGIQDLIAILREKEMLTIKPG